jgi:hypothetical protein
VKTWQQTQIRATPITATLLLATALALGGAGGYAMRALVQPQNVAPASSENSTPVASITDATAGPGPVGAHNRGIGLHTLDREELP